MAGSSKTTAIEKENLEAHVELCAERYRQLETRLENIENKVSTLSSIVEKGQLSTIKVLIGTAGTVVAGVLSTLVIILVKMP
jgi:tetrahydromethanopterin S-methyltransferase subunit G